MTISDALLPKMHRARERSVKYVGRLTTTIRTATIIQATITTPLLSLMHSRTAEANQNPRNRQYEQWGKGGSSKLKQHKVILKKLHVRRQSMK